MSGHNRNDLLVKLIGQLGTLGLTGPSGQAATLQHAFNTVTLQDPTSGAWKMDTCASSYLNDSVTSLSNIFNTCIYPSVSVGDGHTIPVTNTGHRILPTPHKPLHFNNVLITPHIVKNLIFVRQFVRDSNFIVKFDAFGFFVKDFMTRQLFRHKYLADGTLSRYKAHLVVNGSTQLEGIDVDETFSLVVKPGTIRAVLSLATSRHWPIHQLDVKNAFLHGMFLSQRKYATEILERAGIVRCNSSRTPVDTESKLGDDVQQVCLFMHDPREPYFSALKRVLRYVRGTLDYGLQLFLSSTTDLVAYSDADWAGCPTTRRSTSEAEYRGVANVAETCWLRNILRELHTHLSSATLVYCDNVNAVYLSSNLVQHQRTQHIEIDIHFVRDLIAAAQVRVFHVP
ncbi:ribonuclease H-like domain-containing protein [Tanacetum coccineum]